MILLPSIFRYVFQFLFLFACPLPSHLAPRRAAFPVEAMEVSSGGGAWAKVSFRDKLLGGKVAPPAKKAISLVEQGKMRIENFNGNPMLPQVVTNPEVIQELCFPWQEALVVTLLGKRLGYRTMKARLAAVWRLTGDFDLLDIDNGFYMVKFDIAADRTKVMEGGPWMIFDHYLAVSTWSKEFLSPLAKVTKTLAWIRIPGLNVVFYDESFLLGVASAIGKAIRVDSNTLRAERGKFARICVELDLSKPVIGKVCIEGFWHKIEYEGLHIICTKCGCYGHRGRECSGSVVAQGRLAAPSQQQGQAVGNPNATTAETLSQDKELMRSANDAIMGTEAQGKNEGESLISNAIIMEEPIQEVEGEILGEWMVVTKKKRSPRFPTTLGINEGKAQKKTVVAKNKVPAQPELKGKAKMPRSEKEHAGHAQQANQEFAVNGDPRHPEESVTNKVWIKKRKGGPTRAEKENPKYQNSNLMGSLPNFHVGSTSEVKKGEMDMGARVRTQQRATGDPKLSDFGASSFLSSDIQNVVFQAGVSNETAFGSRPPDEAHEAMQVMDLTNEVQPDDDGLGGIPAS